jgi:hypothetical protein
VDLLRLGLLRKFGSRSAWQAPPTFSPLKWACRCDDRDPDSSRRDSLLMSPLADTINTKPRDARRAQPT